MKRAHGQGSIYRDGDYFAASLDLGVVNGKRSRKKFRAKTEVEVQAKLDEWRVAQSQGVKLTSIDPTVAEWLRTWLAERTPRLRPLSVKRYASEIGLHIIPNIGHLKLRELEPYHVESLTQSMIQKGLSARHANGVRSTIRSALRLALKRKVVTHNAASLADPESVVSKETSILTAQQTAQLLEWLTTDPWGDLFTLSLTTGMRIGEVLGLRWQCVDLINGRITVNAQLQWYSAKRAAELKTLPKSATPWLIEWVGFSSALTLVKSDAGNREIALMPSVLEMLKRRREEYEDNELVFTTQMGGPLWSRSIAFEWKRVLSDAGLPYVRPHDARHRVATMMLEAGVSMKTVQVFLGHSSYAVTPNTYSHVRTPLLDDAVDRLGKLLKG